mmetsp:Transcript_9551/g.17337  ORF Transcript_9551/g.17337 Transcript_9551/m.17337 type:complete len:1215 (-) Transcript_9551:353-3997(-)
MTGQIMDNPTIQSALRSKAMPEVRGEEKGVELDMLSAEISAMSLLSNASVGNRPPALSSSSMSTAGEMSPRTLHRNPLNNDGRDPFSLAGPSSPGSPYHGAYQQGAPAPQSQRHDSSRQKLQGNSMPSPIGMSGNSSGASSPLTRLSPTGLNEGSGSDPFAMNRSNSLSFLSDGRWLPPPPSLDTGRESDHNAMKLLNRSFAGNIKHTIETSTSSVVRNTDAASNSGDSASSYIPSTGNEKFETNSNASSGNESGPLYRGSFDLDNPAGSFDDDDGLMGLGALRNRAHSTPGLRMPSNSRRELPSASSPIGSDVVMGAGLFRGSGGSAIDTSFNSSSGGIFEGYKGGKLIIADPKVRASGTDSMGTRPPLSGGGSITANTGHNKHHREVSSSSISYESQLSNFSRSLGGDSFLPREGDRGIEGGSPALSENSFSSSHERLMNIHGHRRDQSGDWNAMNQPKEGINSGFRKIPRSHLRHVSSDNADRLLEGRALDPDLGRNMHDSTGSSMWNDESAAGRQLLQQQQYGGNRGRSVSLGTVAQHAGYTQGSNNNPIGLPPGYSGRIHEGLEDDYGDQMAGMLGPSQSESTRPSIHHDQHQLNQHNGESDQDFRHYDNRYPQTYQQQGPPFPQPEQIQYQGGFTSQQANPNNNRMRSFSQPNTGQLYSGQAHDRYDSGRMQQRQHLVEGNQRNFGGGHRHSSSDENYEHHGGTQHSSSMYPSQTENDRGFVPNNIRMYHPEGGRYENSGQFHHRSRSVSTNESMNEPRMGPGKSASLQNIASYSPDPPFVSSPMDHPQYSQQQSEMREGKNLMGVQGNQFQMEGRRQQSGMKQPIHGYPPHRDFQGPDPRRVDPRNPIMASQEEMMYGMSGMSRNGMDPGTSVPSAQMPGNRLGHRNTRTPQMVSQGSQQAIFSSADSSFSQSLVGELIDDPSMGGTNRRPSHDELEHQQRYSQAARTAPSMIESNMPPSDISKQHQFTAGSGIPVASPPRVVYTVKFKRMQRYFIPGQRIPRDLIKIGCYVKVEADRGEDLGIIMGKMPVEKYNASIKASLRTGTVPGVPGSSEIPGTTGPSSAAISGASGVGDLKRIIRLATHDEVCLLTVKREEEDELLRICRTKVGQRALPMRVVDAEYQFDRHKLTFFFEAEGRIDFRELVRDLFSIYKTRIWMQQLDKNSTVTPLESEVHGGDTDSFKEPSTGVREFSHSDNAITSDFQTS